MSPRLLKMCPLMAAALLASGSTPASRAEPSVGCLVQTAYGQIQGVDQGLTCDFLGIPYVAPPLGNNRWKPPQPAVPWAPSILQATSNTNCSTIQAGNITGQEDCLKLNIWVGNPAPSTPAPVIVWLHTGAFFAASANFGGTNGRRLARETGVIVVAPNYRLGPFGFLAHDALENEDPTRRSAGNYGLLDQRAALEWVQGNIAAFGGDPNNVTLAGTSAGGQSAGLHLVAPGSDGLFHKAIVQSAHPTSGWTSREDALAQGARFAAALGCTVPAQVLTCMRGATRNQVLTALQQGTQQVLSPAGPVFWEPTVDGLVLPDQPRALFELGEFSAVPTMVGAARDEGWGNFIRRSYASGPTLAQYPAWVEQEFGALAPRILAAYPAASFASPEEAMARLVGDGQFVCEARRFADLVADGGLRGRGPHDVRATGKRIKSDVFLYSFEWEIDALSVDHVIHGLESNIIFGNNYTMPGAYTLNAQDELLHHVMAQYWTRFARTGDPNSPSLPDWPVYRKNHEQHITLGTTVGSADDLGEGACDLWRQLFLWSMLNEPPAFD